MKAVAEDAIAAAEALIPIPPFPGSKVRRFKPVPAEREAGDAAEMVAALRKHRIGGLYWGRPCACTVEGRVVVATDVALPLAQSMADGRPVHRLAAGGDPYSVLSGASALICDSGSPYRLLAALWDCPCYLVHGATLVRDQDGRRLLEQASRFLLHVEDPFSGEFIDGVAAVELCGFWRRLIESNRDLAGALGIAFWKQEALAPLLWGGGEPLPFWRSLPARVTGSVAIWRSKAEAADLAQLESRGLPAVEVEDGFLRSAGLGADCVPPLSITVDRLGAYFDPAQESELERLIEHGAPHPDLLARAARLRQTIVAAGLGKYERGGAALARSGGSRTHILVTGQVEDDRSVMTGGLGLGNLALLQRVRAANPQAYILYKPHPDVEAGHRKGAIAPALGAALWDTMVPDQPIASLIDLADEVHVNTSLSGFEALLRGKRVTTYGVPFYAGWGLTTDLGPVPARRTARRSLDELVAFTLLLYPRYLDPVTGLPCPAEVVVDRLCQGDQTHPGLLVSLRRLQGRLRRRLQGLRA